ncbi:hypothetical protein SAMN05518801_10975 [Novosphingobium sp. CF614]|uniref:hypothetical protein n=1 Tax=Novosphingobium sp. CF614 TaxID=1884364 RepID=UPI0008E2AE69|nr:hypothetical protein [Novosphingobium sp. CF614]SFG17867.1 hypothetical protein SAMN05518801_10975 [Novosphingobium sp. CF614]
MPGIYVAQKTGMRGRAGLALPFTPTTGPIDLAVNHGEFITVGQDEPIDVSSGSLHGIKTAHVGECSVLIVAEWAGHDWGRLYFDHVGGSNFELAWPTLKKFTGKVHQQHCYSAVLATTRYNAYALVGELIKVGYPAHCMSAYIASTDTIEVGYAVNGGLFGEISRSSDQKDMTPYGYRGPTAIDTIWP